MQNYSNKCKWEQICYDEYDEGGEEFEFDGDSYHCVKKKKRKTPPPEPPQCPPCPPCPEFPKCLPQCPPPEPPPQPWGALLEEEWGQTGMDKPPKEEDFTKINDEYEDEEANTWFSKPTKEPERVLGCMDVLAENYDADATEDDGSCTYAPPRVSGCMDPLADNFNPAATEDDGSCAYAPPPVPGCIDPTADNYNPEATEDDGSCVYAPPPVPGCMDPEADNYNPEATEDDGSCTYPPPRVLGCTDPEAENYNEAATEDDGSCTYIPPPVPGCMDPTADNYNEAATEDDGSCTYAPPPVPGCMDPTAENYNEAATEDDGSCTYPPPPPPTPPPEPESANGYSQDYSIVTTKPTQAVMFDQLHTYSGTRQDPDGIDWLAGSSHWTNSTWDGNPFDLTGKSKEDICAFLRPSHGYVVRGIREHFYDINPFADNSNPTDKEIDDWNVEVIRHFRRMFGITTPITPDARLYLECRWSDERKWTTAWDTKYPDGEIGKAGGPCWDASGNGVDTSGGHCGDAFFPTNPADRAPYIAAAPYNNNLSAYPELDGYNERYALTGGNNAVNAGLNWSIRLAWIVAQWMCLEGTTGHAGPYLSRERFGCSWWYDPGPLKTVNYKGKWR